MEIQAELLSEAEPQILNSLQTQDKAHANWGGFLLQDILWAVGVWSVILTLSPVIMFYVLMVN